MRKDPAVLFYYSDFLVGTEFMTDEEVGKYIRLLCHQADKGRLTKKQVQSVCKANAIPESILEKLTIDESGLYYQKRMEEEKIKRSKFVESRRNSAKGIKSVSKAYARRMEDINKNTNEIVISNNGFPKKEEVLFYFTESGYSKEMGESFFSYYDAQEWRTTSGVSIAKRWQSKVIGWINNQKQYEVKDAVNKGNKPRGSIDFDKYAKEQATIKPRSS